MTLLNSSLLQLWFTFMHFQTETRVKPFPAFLTFKWPNSCMKSKVHIQTGCSCKCLITNRTNCSHRFFSFLCFIVCVLKALHIQIWKQIKEKNLFDCIMECNFFALSISSVKLIFTKTVPCTCHACFTQSILQKNGWRSTMTGFLKCKLFISLQNFYLELFGNGSW